LDEQTPSEFIEKLGQSRTVEKAGLLLQSIISEEALVGLFVKGAAVQGPARLSSPARTGARSLIFLG